ncbi:glycosyltransferase family 2 protein [Marisediminicola sp. LYQ85]|uniref:glycosyltransferase family 2 protein n=1 Tax=Marisediminicola sp. LYQ85 TaxID=3391062 RepID=UPI0039834406
MSDADRANAGVASPKTPLTCVVAVLTYLRPVDLAELLPALVEQSAGAPATVTILVVDNDPAGGARHQVAALALDGVDYVHEPTPGIAAARNTALLTATSADVLVFIDDDERPTKGWLYRLLTLYLAEHPAAVIGPVVSEFGGELDPWIKAGRFFDRRRLPTGTTVTVAATNNLLLDMAVVRRLGLAFDLRFGISGGSDTLFTRQLANANAPMLWHDEAVVFDVVPPHRQTREWVLQRAFRSGNSWSGTALALETHPLRRFALRARLTAEGALRIAGGGAYLAVASLTRSLARNAQGHRMMRRGLGMAAGAWGHRYFEYRR